MKGENNIRLVIRNDANRREWSKNFVVLIERENNNPEFQVLWDLFH
jgi:hypothetical protein